ncbi:hypothetical protein L910_1952 [Vibrio fluvialis PG41]|uniref:Uncharacterized protein n=1 Tax=Vibrio fluvialis PG41 TaxID=1336752 RepID=S7HXK9_VIBFL|nr:hypothetical protein L910_1952 [Vibrio fluvialis PG41]
MRWTPVTPSVKLEDMKIMSALLSKELSSIYELAILMILGKFYSSNLVF